MRLFLATLLLCLLVLPAQSRPASYASPDDRFAHTVQISPAMHRKAAAHTRRTFRRHAGRWHRGHHVRGRAHAHAVSGPAQIVAHPAGCPSRAFCGCGVASYIFGSPVRALWLAAAWLRYPPAAPAPGMVAVRRHHVFAIVAVHSPGVVLAFDPNSGGHRTRIHLRSLAGYRVVNPKAG